MPNGNDQFVAVTYRWLSGSPAQCPGHAEVRGNEIEDKLADEALVGGAISLYIYPLSMRLSWSRPTELSHTLIASIYWKQLI